MKYSISTRKFKLLFKWTVLAQAIIVVYFLALSNQSPSNWIQTTSMDATQPQIIPKIIHHTWKDENIPEKWKHAYQSCVDKYPDYEFILWTDEKSRTFITENYSWLERTFVSYWYPIQRADAICYLVLYHFGGIYLDLDIGCRDPSLNDLRIFPAIVPKTKPIGYSNDMLAAHPKHPFFEQLIHNLPKWNGWFVFPYLTVIFSTGPMYLNIQYWTTTLCDIWILPPELYSEGKERYFSHYEGSSWHSWDADVIKLIWTKRYALLFAIAITIYWYRRKETKRKRKLELPL
jgi:mannosyltransferase OCH1-like enzyme